jgi:hypothetical protein
MGLDTTHNAWHGPYSAFNRFRELLMIAYNGSNLRGYEGFGGNLSMDNIEDAGLKIFFNHSDCDGEITAADCHLVANGLRSLSEKINDEYNTMRLKEFIAGCELAHSLDETLEFH